MTDETATIRGIYEAFASGDIATVLGALDPKIESIEAAGSAYAGTYTGPDAVLSGILARLAADWNPFHVAPDWGRRCVLAVNVSSNGWRSRRPASRHHERLAALARIRRRHLGERARLESLLNGE